MRIEVAAATLELIRGDITRQATDAIVNAANSALRGGGGVDGAIHRAGGPAIMEESRRIGRCPTGQAVITTAGDLPARKVIHTVGPRWRGGDSGEPALLAGAYRRSLQLAVDNGLSSVAFPSISTGAYGYPVEEAARVALRTVAQFLEQNPGSLELVRFVLFTQDDLCIYEQTLRDMAAQ
ncbi:MAG: O-acetyl-ADP-ribose deacetylase [Planctomycetes bacterium]|nr:O-acetyl-ADP-ribose deacetylase [Planctomycetota bacterium]